MKKTRIISAILTSFVIATVFTGCTNWKKRYNALNVEHENLKGLYENCKANTGQAIGIADELAACRAQNQDLAAQLSDCTKMSSASKETGFEGMDQKYDSATGQITVTLPNAILFNSGKANLKSSSISQLNKVISVLKERYAGKEVDVIGHTDSDPIKKSKWKDNWQLGSERALAVVRYLQKKGINASALRSVSCGQYRPVGSNKSKNRRVEIVIHTR